ncbi:unnamed protein product, partial [Polarella glacialis]
MTAELRHRGPGPSFSSSETPAEGSSSAASAASRQSLAWAVPAVSLPFVLKTLLPAMAPTASEVSLVLRRSGTVGSAWEALMSGTTRAQRARLHYLTVEWTPGDTTPCIDMAKALLREGFARRGPLFCQETERSVELSFKRGLGLPGAAGAAALMAPMGQRDDPDAVPAPLPELDLVAADDQ